MFSFKTLIPIVLILSACYLHFRGKERISFRRQLFNHSTLLLPYNIFMYWFSAVPNTPVVEKGLIPELEVAKSNWKVFRKEAIQLMESGHVIESMSKQDIAFNSFFKTGWKRFYLKWYDDPMPSAIDLCPKSVEIINKIPQINAAMFALLPPGGRLGKHRDPFAGSLRYHLGLSTPNSEECYIWIDDVFHSWKDGEDILFDETYVHWALNDTEQPRMILFCDVNRPLKTKFIRSINNFVVNNIIKITKSHNTEIERVGGLNRISSAVFKLKTFFTYLKKSNRKLYYSAKYILLTIIAYLIFWPLS